MRAEKLYLSDIIEAIDLISTFVEGVDEAAFLDSELLASAALYQFVIIGEAANNVSDALRKRYPAVAWRKAIGLRNVAAHGYFSVVTSRIWGTIRDDLPVLRRQIASIIEAEYPDTESETGA